MFSLLTMKKRENLGRSGNGRHIYSAQAQTSEMEQQQSQPETR